MKKLVFLMSLLCLTSNAFSKDCISAYEKKADSRDSLNKGVIGTTIPVIGVGLALTAFTPAVIYIGGLALSPAFVDDYDFLPNQFETIKNILVQSKSGDITSYDAYKFKEFSELIRKKAFEDYQVVLTDLQVSKALNTANASKAICPVVKIKRNGNPKTAVLNKKALVKYISDFAVNGSAELPFSKLGIIKETLPVDSKCSVYFASVKPIIHYQSNSTGPNAETFFVKKASKIMEQLGYQTRTQSPDNASYILETGTDVQGRQIIVQARLRNHKTEQEWTVEGTVTSKTNERKALERALSQFPKCL